jgi:hypothetical protein
MCSGPIDWSHSDKCYQCLICDYKLPSNYNAEDDPIIVPGGNQTSDDFLREFADVLDDGGYVFPDDDDDDESMYIEKDGDTEEVEEPSSLYARAPKAMYKERQDKPQKREDKMPRRRNKKACRICGTDKTVRGGPLKRFYGPNKDVCLKCFYEHKDKLDTVVPEVVEEPEPVYQTQKAAPPAPYRGLAEDLALFDQEGNFVGRYNDVHELAAAAAKTGAGAQVFRLMHVEVTIRVDIEGRQVF